MRAPRSSLAFVVGLAMVWGSPACTDDPGDTGSGVVVAESVFVLPASLSELSGKTFFDQPFPSDLRRDADGSVRFTGWPNPSNVPLLNEFLAITPGLLHGFSPVAAINLRFSSPLDPTTLSASPPDTASPSSVVQLVDVDEASPERGKRRLVMTSFKAEVLEDSYWPSYTLAIMPVLGQPLRPSTKYAAVVTRSAKAVGGGEVRPNHVLSQLLGLEPAGDVTQEALALFTPAVAELATAGVPASSIAHMTVFTTDDPTKELFSVFDDVKNQPAPTAHDWKLVSQGSSIDVYEGLYGPSPNYQAGTVPYRLPENGGGFVFENGVPKVQNTFESRFALAVPNKDACPPPAGGYPIVLYAHGTGGDYRSFIDDRTAESLGAACLASMGVDQIFHGTRPGAPPDSDPTKETTIQLLFFNFDNPAAARTNNRQSAVDVLQQARLFTETHVAVPSSVAAGGADVAFDATKLSFFGHSQGAVKAPLYLAGSDTAKGAVLSGAGSMLAVALLDKTKPLDISAAVRFLVCGGNQECRDEVDLFHPAITLAQTVVDVSDPIHYASFVTTSPRPGFAAKSVYQTAGIAADGSGDTYSPPRALQALGVAMRVPRIAPGTRPIEEAAWLGLADVTIPAEGLRGNLPSGATGALAQFAPKPGKDGHFVVFDVPAARAQSTMFLRTLADEGLARVVP